MTRILWCITGFLVISIITLLSLSYAIWGNNAPPNAFVGVCIWVGSMGVVCFFVSFFVSLEE